MKNEFTSEVRGAFYLQDKLSPHVGTDLATIVRLNKGIVTVFTLEQKDDYDTSLIAPGQKKDIVVPNEYTMRQLSLAINKVFPDETRWGVLALIGNMVAAETGEKCPEPVKFMISHFMENFNKSK